MAITYPYRHNLSASLEPIHENVDEASRRLSFRWQWGLLPDTKPSEGRVTLVSCNSPSVVAGTLPPTGVVDPGVVRLSLGRCRCAGANGRVTLVSCNSPSVLSPSVVAGTLPPTGVVDPRVVIIPGGRPRALPGSRMRLPSGHSSALESVRSLELRQEL